MSDIFDVVPVNPKILDILGKQQVNKEFEYRLMKYCLTYNVHEGVLIYNLVTGSLLLIKYPARLIDLLESREIKLIEEWFFVPLHFNEIEWYRKLQDNVRIRNYKGYFSNFVILPTFDCNARCYYCFEHGTPKVSMNKDIACDVGAFITKQYQEKDLHITWFGGEPLVNIDAIECISEKLNLCNIKFDSSIVTNGYLLSAKTIDNAVKYWNLKRANITLDGTKNKYNMIKRYIYPDENAFATVLENIAYLCEAGVTVKVRIHVEDDNVKDLFLLIDLLHNRFGSFKGFSIYPMLLYPDTVSPKDKNNFDDYRCLQKINEKLTGLGYKKPQMLRSRITAYACMADNGNSIVIDPVGRLSKCEHITENTIVGNVWEGITSPEIVEDWKTRVEEKHCESCPLLPTCNILELCPIKRPCNSFLIELKQKEIMQDVMYSYECWKEI